MNSLHISTFQLPATLLHEPFHFEVNRELKILHGPESDSIIIHCVALEKLFGAFRSFINPPLHKRTPGMIHEEVATAFHLDLIRADRTLLHTEWIFLPISLVYQLNYDCIYRVTWR